ncbi:gap junction delta-3 protein-like [Cololabis saira]|uniref:gap junction delta-3 protein-like n=1 Tax=Cololabis saira TaxID=129043 RepID=UPI002AD3F068|nr:gap junction delta-3 protein-like [Cololabis saira]XP_061564858.1 gap junction delta-3 protein-like [Cololabis saira]
MAEWGFLGGFFDNLQAHSPMLGRFWLLLMLVFRMLILGTVASDLFDDEQEEFTCNTLQPGCKQVCYDMAFPISQYRFWVFHIVLIATPSLLFLMYASHHHAKRATRSKSSQSSCQDYREDKNLQRLYIVNVVFRILAETGFIVGQYLLYGFEVNPQFPCSRFPCPYTVDCFTSRPMEKTVFLCFYFAVGILAMISSVAELFYSSTKWFCTKRDRFGPDHSCTCHNIQNRQQEESGERMGLKMGSESVGSCEKLKRLPLRKSTGRKARSIGIKQKCGKYVDSKTLMV